MEGHADVIGSTQYNQRLGERRAQAVREFLIKYV
jgi:outer membrane protein OmpA-like peptidoglycan-associated protein